MKKDKFKGYKNPFASKLRLLMKVNKTKQYQIAQRLNITRQSISQYMSGETLPTVDKLNEIANFYNVSADFLLGRDDEQKNIEKIENFFDVVVPKEISRLFDEAEAKEKCLKNFKIKEVQK